MTPTRFTEYNPYLVKWYLSGPDVDIHDLKSDTGPKHFTEFLRGSGICGYSDSREEGTGLRITETFGSLFLSVKTGDRPVSLPNRSESAFGVR